MPLVVKDRVQVTTSTAGTGTYTLAGAVAGYQSFSVIGDGNTTYYAVTDGVNWEVGIGTYTASGTTLSRNTILESSNAGAAVNWSAGVKSVFVTYPAEVSVDQSDVGTAPNQLPLNQYLGNLAYQNAGSIAGPVVIGDNSTSAALRITQTGTGNALVVEDSANPDASPFVVDANGRVIVGATSNTTGAGGFFLQSVGSNTAAAGYSLSYFANDVGSGQVRFTKSRGGSTPTNTLVASGDALGEFSFFGADGTNYVPAAQIVALVDGTPGTNDMPGRLVFGTTADGASSPTERMRIDNAGNFMVGTSTPRQLATFSQIANSGMAIELENRSTAAVTTKTVQINFSGFDTVGTYKPTGLITSAPEDSNWVASRMSFSVRASDIVTERMRIASTGTISLGAAPGSESLRVTPVASAVNYVQATGAATGGVPSITAQGTDTNINFSINAKNGGGIFLDTSNTAATAFGVELSSATTVDRATYIDFHSSVGTDYDFRLIRPGGVNATVQYINAGTGAHQFLTNTTAEQFRIAHTASAVNYLQATGGATGAAAVLSAQGSDANVELDINSKGTGPIAFNTNSTQRFVIGGSGQLGIGTTPDYGSAGQTLTSRGSAAAPAWSNPGVISALVFGL